MKELIITKEHIDLYIILKLEGLTTTGGEAKLVISDGQVRVNGEVELRKRKKIYSGDVVKFDGQSIRVKRA